MFEYLIILVSFGFLIALRIFLFRKSYNRNLSFYSDPDEFVPEMIQSLEEKNRINPSFKRDFLHINNQSAIAKLNLEKISSECKDSFINALLFFFCFLI